MQRWTLNEGLCADKERRPCGLPEREFGTAKFRAPPEWQREQQRAGVRVRRVPRAESARRSFASATRRLADVLKEIARVA